MLSALERQIKWLWKPFELQPGKPAIALGLRTALALCVPIILGVISDRISWGTTAALAALYVSIADVGGAYRDRAVVLFAAMIGVAVAMPLAAVVGSSWWLAVIATFLWVFAAGLMGLYGNSANTVGFITSMMFVVSIAAPIPPTLLQRLALCLAGGSWAMILSLGLWVVHPYKPVLKAVAKCYLNLAALIEQASQFNRDGISPQQRLREMVLLQDALTRDIETARKVWSAVRYSRQGASCRGIQLLVLLQDAGQLMTVVVALTETLEVVAEHPRLAVLEVEIHQAMQQLVNAMHILASAIASGGRTTVLLTELDSAIATLESKRQNLQTQHYQHTHDYYGLINIRKIVSSIQALTEQLHTDVDIAAQLQNDRKISVTQPNINKLTVWDRNSILNTLRDNLTLRSTGLRHALRLGLTAAVAIAIADLLQIPRGNWVALTVLVILKPNFGGTWKTAIQRIGGTILGGIVAVFLASLIHNHVLLLGSMFVLTVIAFALKPLNYGLYVLLLTPLIILLINITNTGNWEISLVRIFDTLIGGGLALIGGYLLFPSWERQQLPVQLAKTIQADLTYFQQVIANYIDSTQNIDSISAVRHRAALENANATAAAQRLLSEPRHLQGAVEPVMTLLAYTRSFYNSVTTLTEHLREFSGQYPMPGLQLFETAIIRVLENLVDVLQHKLPLQPLPNIDTLLEEIHDHIQQLHTNRMAELTTRPHEITPTLQAVRDKTVISTEVARIAHEVCIMHKAIARFQASVWG